jgi:hypothetical protein
MFEIKTILSLIAVILTFVGYAPYIRSLAKNHTKPHIYSWFIWSLDGFIIFALQFTHGAGPGSFVVLAASLLALTVLFLTILNKGKRDITLIDTIFTVLALLALIVWLFAKQPLISVILIMIVDVLGFLPTVRKSWHGPFTENAAFYAINVMRFAMALTALQAYSIITALYPAVWLIINALFTVMLVLRRKVI